MIDADLAKFARLRSAIGRWTPSRHIEGLWVSGGEGWRLAFAPSLGLDRFTWTATVDGVTVRGARADAFNAKVAAEAAMMGLLDEADAIGR